MNKYKKPKFTEVTLGVNPFVESLVIEVNRIPFVGSYKKVGDGFEQIIGKVEYDPVCKVYVNPNKRKLIAGMRNCSKSLFTWVMYELESGKDYLWINRIRYMEENNIASVNTFKAALTELIRYGVLTGTTVTGVYWINPTYFFSGNRISKYPKKVKEN